MPSITVTHYTEGEGVPFYLPGGERLAVQDALADMFRRFRDGAEIVYSGFNRGLTAHVSLESYDTAIYGGLDPKLERFLKDATKWREQGLSPDTTEHDAFLRCALLAATGHELSPMEMVVALSMKESDFLAAMAMAVENGENVSALFVN